MPDHESYGLLTLVLFVSDYLLLRDVNEWINKESSESVIFHLNLSN